MIAHGQVEESSIQISEPLPRTFWGPIVPRNGTRKWGGPTLGKLEVLYAAIDARLPCDADVTTSVAGGLRTHK